MKKKVLKLAKGLTKFTLDDIQIMSEINESELLAILEELKKEGSLQTIKNNEYIYIPPVSKSAISTPQPENSRNDLKPENIIGYEAYLKTEGKQKVYAEKYFNLINACGNLKGEKLKNFIDNKWNKMFPEYRASYSRLIKIRKMFLQNGFYALLPCWNFNKGKSCILDELYSLFIDEYFSFNAPTLSEAARQAKKKFVELNPDFEICQLPAEGTFAKKLKRELPCPRFY